jgi:hypothetical protein
MYLLLLRYYFLNAPIVHVRFVALLSEFSSVSMFIIVDLQTSIVFLVCRNFYDQFLYKI